MVWTPFGNTTSSTATAHEPMQPTDGGQAAPQHHQMPPMAAQPEMEMAPQAMPQQAPQGDDQWYGDANNFEGQLAVDVFQTANDIVIKAPIAGVSPQDIDIAITDDVVTIKGQRQVEESVAAEDYYCQECYYGVFSRSIILPVAVLTEQADATFSNGVLTVKIPKAANARTKKLQVKPV